MRGQLRYNNGIFLLILLALQGGDLGNPLAFDFALSRLFCGNFRRQRLLLFLDLRQGCGGLLLLLDGHARAKIGGSGIHTRHRRGLTRDERFAPLLDSVRLLGRTAAQALARQRIDHLWA